jgi:hypothetical protein
MNMSGVATGKNLRQAKEGRISLGEYFSVQVDKPDYQAAPEHNVKCRYRHH